MNMDTYGNRVVVIPEASSSLAALKKYRSAMSYNGAKPNAAARRPNIIENNA